MSSRTKARKRAIDLLYGADLRNMAIADLVAEGDVRAAGEPDRAASWEYARQIAEGVDAAHETIDASIRTHAQGWTLERMPVVDRAIARVGVWEILYNDEVPDGVAIAEAVASARSLSTDDSAGFLNGLLSAISREPTVDPIADPPLSEQAASPSSPGSGEPTAAS